MLPGISYTPMHDKKIEETPQDRKGANFIIISKIIPVARDFLKLETANADEKLHEKEFSLIGMSPEDLNFLFGTSKPSALAIEETLYLPCPIESLPPGTIMMETKKYKENYPDSKQIAAFNLSKQIKTATKVNIAIATSTGLDLTFEKKQNLVDLITRFVANNNFLQMDKIYFLNKKKYPSLYFSVIQSNRESIKKFIKITGDTKLIIRTQGSGIILVEDKIVSKTEVFDFSISQNNSYAAHRKVLQSIIEKGAREFLLQKNLFIGLPLTFDCGGITYSITLNSAKTPEKMHDVSKKLIRFHFPEDAQFTLQPGSNLTIEPDPIVVPPIVEESKPDVAEPSPEPQPAVEPQAEPAKEEPAEVEIKQEPSVPEKKAPPISFSEYAAGQGILSVPKGLQRVLQTITVHHGPLKETAAKRGILPEPGLLLYGPPGNGKSSFANLIVSYLHEIGLLELKNSKIIKATSLIESTIGSTEKNIRVLFSKAREDSEKLGKESPLHVIIFDELEGLLPHRTNAKNNQWDITILNAFIGELGQLGAIRNILVIGLTNHKELIDPAVLRSGRLGSGILISTPDEAQRKELLAVLLNKEYHSKDIDIESLAKASDGLSFADITGVVEKANSTAFDRAYELYNKGLINLEEIGTHPDGIITMYDLISFFKDERFSKGLELLDIIKEIMELQQKIQIEKIKREIEAEQTAEKASEETKNTMYL